MTKWNFDLTKSAQYNLIQAKNNFQNHYERYLLNGHRSRRLTIMSAGSMAIKVFRSAFRSELLPGSMVRGAVLGMNFETDQIILVKALFEPTNLLEPLLQAGTVLYENGIVTEAGMVIFEDYVLPGALITALVAIGFLAN